MDDSSTTIKDLKDTVKKFCEDRDWDQFHNPKDLAIGIVTEASELLEIFRWKSLSEVEEMEMYVKEGLYSSKAEFVREAVRRMIIELRKQMFWQDISALKKKSRSRGAKIKTPFLTKEEKEKLFEEFEKKLKKL